MRLFVAIVPSGRARQQVAAAARSWLGGHPDVRLIAVESLHLTLLFIGEVAAHDLSSIEGRLRQATAGHEPFPLATRDWGWFPARRRPRVYWLRLAESGALAALAETVKERLSEFSVGSERDFSPHLTVARVSHRETQPMLLTPPEPPAVPDWRVDKICLVRSHLGIGPAHYETLAVIPLRAARESDS